MTDDPKLPENPTLADYRAYVEALRAKADRVESLVVSLEGATSPPESEPVHPGDAVAMPPVEPIVPPHTDLPRLTTEVTHATDNGMTSSALSIGPSRGPLPDGDGPATKIMRELGFANLAELAKALGERHGTVRSWNMRDGGLPDRVLPAVQKLRASRTRKTRGK